MWPGPRNKNWLRRYWPPVSSSLGDHLPFGPRPYCAEARDTVGDFNGRSADCSGGPKRAAPGPGFNCDSPLGDNWPGNAAIGTDAHRRSADEAALHMHASLQCYVFMALDAAVHSRPCTDAQPSPGHNVYGNDFTRLDFQVLI